MLSCQGIMPASATDAGADLYLKVARADPCVRMACLITWPQVPLQAQRAPTHHDERGTGQVGLAQQPGGQPKRKMSRGRTCKRLPWFPGFSRADARGLPTPPSRTFTAFV